MVEVIIPTRNAPEMLWLTLLHLWSGGDEGIISQVTLLDNRSTAPGMDAVLGEARRRGCRVIRHERNIGVWASVNRGLALAQSSRVFVLTADVLLAPMAITNLNHVMGQAPENVVFLGPWIADWNGLTGLQGISELATRPTSATLETTYYNGAAWLMRWDVLKEQMGWFDPNFYVCAGDTDYIERLRLGGLAHGVVREILCVHLDKQIRRRESSATQDTEVEIRDLTYFHEKWRGHPDVLAKHPVPDVEVWEQLKRNWKEAIVQ